MKTTAKNILYFLIILLNIQCTAYMPISKELPPEIEVDEKENTIQLINFYDFNKLDFNNEKKIKVFITGANKMIEGLEKSFAADSHFNLYVSDSLKNGNMKCQSQALLNKDSIELFCLEKHISLLLTLDEFDISLHKEMEVEENEDGSKSRTAHYELNVVAAISLYNSSGEIINRSRLREAEHYKSRSVISGLLAVGPSLARAGDEVNSLAKSMGEGYINKFYPTTISEQRYYYTGKKFSEVTPYIKNFDWQKAIEFLLPLAKSNDTKLARKAAHNLSVVYEALGNYNEAEFWLQKSGTR